jgi:hypothetical protein
MKLSFLHFASLSPTYKLIYYMDTKFSDKMSDIGLKCIIAIIDIAVNYILFVWSRCPCLTSIFILNQLILKVKPKYRGWTDNFPFTSMQVLAR